jgi:hypothetical protein
MKQLSFTGHSNGFFFYSVADCWNGQHHPLYDIVVIIYSVFEWFLFFTVWLIAGTVNIIRL